MARKFSRPYNNAHVNLLDDQIDVGTISSSAHNDDTRHDVQHLCSVFSLAS